MNRKRLIFFIKLAISAGIVAFIYLKIVRREGTADLADRLAELSWGWIAVAICMQLGAIFASIYRWDRLLVGQGIHAPFRHLFGSFMIGRFFGAFTPGGWTGLNGYRLYDIATQTGKTARSTATIGIEMVLGQLAFGAVVIAGSIFGLEIIGTEGVLMVDGFFVVLITAAIVLLSRPALFRAIGKLLPGFVQARLQTTIDAVCAYQGKGALVTQAALLGMATHAFNNLIYVCTAHALGVELGVGEVFFVSAMQIFSTLVPASVNGIGLREATAVALYTSVGVPASVAFLVPTVGFTVEMFVSAFGGLIFLGRRVGYSVDIRVDDADREDAVAAQIEIASPEQWPRRLRGLIVGASAGLAGGALVGVGEGVATLAAASGDKDYGVLFYGAAAYGLACMFGGAGLGLVLAQTGRWLRREAVPEPMAYGRIAALITAFGAFAIGAFRIRRDVFHEAVKWKSLDGLLLVLGCMFAAAVLFVVVSVVLTVLARRGPGSRLLRGYTPPALLSAMLALAFATAGTPSTGAPESLAALQKPAAPEGAGNVLFVVVDTLRADYLPLYGHDAIQTPHLDAFAEDAMLFTQAFSNASWTRPSFASLMTGRYPSSHRTTLKSSSLPDEIETLAEAMQDGGYTTYGVVTNYNVAPFFNFHQGFDHYAYLEPEFVLGANDTAAKLLFVQFLRQRIEKVRAASGQVEEGSAYRDAEAVNAAIVSFLDQQRPDGPFYVFAGYMDPHDPYYPHPYDGTGYSRAANQHPNPEEAPALRELYKGEIAFWDQHFGALMAELKRRGLYDDMTIVVTSDHGEEFMEHGGYWHGTTLYDEQVHVPLIVKLPGNRRGGQMIAHWVQSIDIMPTLLKEAGLQVPAGVQGEGLLSGSDTAFAEEDHEGNLLRALRIKRPGGVELKVIEANPGNPRGLEPYELYRLDRDPDEQRNLATEEPKELESVASALEAQGRVAERGRASGKSVDVAADAAAMQKLRALGYAEEDSPEPTSAGPTPN